MLILSPKGHDLLRCMVDWQNSPLLTMVDNCWPKRKWFIGSLCEHNQSLTLKISSCWDLRKQLFANPKILLYLCSVFRLWTQLICHYRITWDGCETRARRRQKRIESRLTRDLFAFRLSPLTRKMAFSHSEDGILSFGRWHFTSVHLKFNIIYLYNWNIVYYGNISGATICF